MADQRGISRIDSYEAFVQEAVEADEEAERTGFSYAAEDVYRYMADLAKGKAVERPKLKNWCK